MSGQEPDNEIIARELCIAQGVDVVAGMPYVTFATFFCILIPVVQGGPAVLWGWPMVPLVGMLLCTVSGLRSYFKLSGLPRPKSVSKRRMRSLSMFSAALGACVSAFITALSLLGTPELQVTAMGLAIIGVVVALGINSVASALFFAIPLAFAQWVTVIWVGLLDWATASLVDQRFFDTAPTGCWISAWPPSIRFLVG